MSISSARIARAAVRRTDRDACEVIKSGDDTLSDVAAVLGARTVAEHLEFVPVVALEELHDQQAHRMLAEVRGNVAEPDPIVPVSQWWT